MLLTKERVLPEEPQWAKLAYFRRLARWTLLGFDEMTCSYCGSRNGDTRAPLPPVWTRPGDSLGGRLAFNRTDGALATKRWTASVEDRAQGYDTPEWPRDAALPVPAG